MVAGRYLFVQCGGFLAWTGENLSFPELVRACRSPVCLVFEEYFALLVVFYKRMIVAVLVLLLLVDWVEVI